MGLKIVHILFITASILLTLGFAGWCFREERLASGPTWFWLGLASSILAFGLMIYGVWFVRKSRNIVD